MSLYCETTGQGADVVLIHGWGMHSGIWGSFAEQLAQHYRVTTIDLPGHGRSPLPAGGFDLLRLAQLLVETAPANAAWVGWSIGGIAALQAALLHPQAMNRLTMIGALPQFVQSEDWPHAVVPASLETFASSLENDPTQTLQRFLSLQVRGCDDEENALKMIKQQVASRPAPQLEALRLGLEVLRRANLRSQLHKLSVPLQIMLGDRDMLVPLAGGQAFRQRVPTARCSIISNAGHAPFMSHREPSLQALREFLDDRGDS
jgi:pimeloyl-[acyl-carrier protein] methyl ester esterase